MEDGATVGGQRKIPNSEFTIPNSSSDAFASLDGDALGEVSRLIDVKAELHRHVVGEEL